MRFAGNFPLEWDVCPNSEKPFASAATAQSIAGLALPQMSAVMRVRYAVVQEGWHKACNT
jgi:hypothetical protein